jgi:predicted ArsR family transcriptional regulator
MTPAKVPIRRRYLAYLRKNLTSTVADLARAMNVTPANVRHHLAELQADGLVELVETRRSAQRGRPLKVYGLSRLVYGDNMNQLADVVLTDWFSILEKEDISEAMSRIASQMIGDSKYISGHISRRLGLAVEKLNQMNYHARWEAHAGGPRMIFESCPYAHVISSHPQLCQMDTQILQNLLDTDIEQIANREKGTKNVPVCIFSILGKL